MQLGLVFLYAGYRVQAGQHLRKAMIWLPPTMEGHKMRVMILEALAELRQSEVLEEVEGAQIGMKELIEVAYVESLELYQLALNWGKLCPDHVTVNIGTLLKKFFFCRGLLSSSTC